MLHDLLHHRNHLLGLLCMVSTFIALQEHVNYHDLSYQAHPALYSMSV